MTDRKTTSPRLVNVRRVSTLTGVVALTAAGVIAVPEAFAEGEAAERTPVIESPAESVIEAEGEGVGEAHAADDEGEGEGAAAEGEGEGAAHGAEGEGEGAVASGSEGGDDVALLTGLAFMEGHIRAGLALYEEGDLAAAKTHMGHPIEEKYEAVEAQLERSGHGVLEEQIAALAAATEDQADLTEVKALFSNVRETMEAVRTDHSAEQQVASLIGLTRIAGAEYTAAVADDGSVSDLHEYQDSWGFLRVVETEATQMAESDDEILASVARVFLDQVALTAQIYGDLQGNGTFDTDPSVIYGGAARMELASLKLKSSSIEVEGEGEGGEGEGGASTASEGESD